MYLQKRNTKIIFIESSITPNIGNNVKSIYDDREMKIKSISPEIESNPFDRNITCTWNEGGSKKEKTFKLIELRDFDQQTKL
jgi:hypothetical protein